MKGTDDPPSLEHIAEKTTREWIYAWLKNPQAYSATATMPNFQLSDDDARDVSAFLIAQSTPIALPATAQSAGAKPAPPADATAGASAVRRILLRLLPRGAERRRQTGGRRPGPGADPHRHQGKAGVAGSWLRNPGAYDPDTKMPHYRFDEQADRNARRISWKRRRIRDLLANVHLPRPRRSRSRTASSW